MPDSVESTSSDTSNAPPTVPQKDPKSGCAIGASLMGCFVIPVLLLGLAAFIAFIFLPDGYGRVHRQPVSQELGELKQIATALKIYAIENDGRVPASLDELSTILSAEKMQSLFVDKDSGEREPIEYLLTGGEIFSEIRPDAKILRHDLAEHGVVVVRGDLSGRFFNAETTEGD